MGAGKDWHREKVRDVPGLKAVGAPVGANLTSSVPKSEILIHLFV